MTKKNEPLNVVGVVTPPGATERVELKVSRLPTGTQLTVPLQVVNGAKPGPVMWVSAAVHGDELNGVEIVRRVLERIKARSLAGALIAAPLVNVFGFIDQSRYLPDRRDLNRSFPGSANGSLASRLAHKFLDEVVSNCHFGIDLHTGSNFRTNLPQIRANLSDAQTRACAEAFGAPVVMHAQTRDGSLRHAATKRGIPVLVYEAGEPMRFDEDAISRGVNGVLRVMAHLGMRSRKAPLKPYAGQFIRESVWARAKQGGILRLSVQLGQRVSRKEPLGVIADAFGAEERVVTSPIAGMVIGHTTSPLVHQGDAIIHVGKTAPDA
ncbi:aspartoacylase [Posidoniimonas corsicana]|uniref:Aspartoacylase n=1 Tax=Posidoniimonas corsicana TaxID=1938618 RepID=A0A5C5VIJ6_9BACT|nr:succinylglutamate desuccinylase/aspartoacylase family protein [Posidoniimonas corsicana]TWT37585.1 aspartoacylase [Posidoniimonas corsicana]